MAYFALPNSVEAAPFLPPDEQAFVAARLRQNKPAGFEENDEFVSLSY